LTGPVQAKRADTTVNQLVKENSIQRNGRQRAVLKGYYSELELAVPRVPLRSRVGCAIPNWDVPKGGQSLWKHPLS
jgi:hypothetical protein